MLSVRGYRITLQKEKGKKKGRKTGEVGKKTDRQMTAQVRKEKCWAWGTKRKHGRAFGEIV